MLTLIRVAPKTTLYYLMENTALRLYANVTHRVRHFNGSISMISVDKQAKDLGLIAADICPENIRARSERERERAVRTPRIVRPTVIRQPK